MFPSAIRHGNHLVRPTTWPICSRRSLRHLYCGRLPVPVSDDIWHSHLFWRSSFYGLLTRPNLVPASNKPKLFCWTRPFGRGLSQTGQIHFCVGRKDKLSAKIKSNDHSSLIFRLLLGCVMYAPVTWWNEALDLMCQNCVTTRTRINAVTSKQGYADENRKISPSSIQTE